MGLAVYISSLSLEATCRLENEIRRIAEDELFKSYWPIMIGPKPEWHKSILNETEQ